MAVKVAYVVNFYLNYIYEHIMLSLLPGFFHADIHSGTGLSYSRAKSMRLL